MEHISEAINQVVPDLASSPNPENTTTSQKSCLDWRRIPPRFRGKKFSDFVPNGSDPRRSIIDSLISGKGVFITGPCGTGKTHLAVAAMNEYIPTLDKVTLPGKYIPQDVSFEFLPSSEFFLTLKASFSHDTGEIEVLSKFAGVKILLLDDIGSEKVSDWSKQMFYALIDRRYRNMAQTVITSNLTLQQLSETIDDRIASRISEMCLVVELKGNDFRLKQS